MFVQSIRMNTIKLIGIALLAVFAIVMLFIFIPSGSTPEAVSETIRFDKMKTDSDRIGFLTELGYTVDEAPIESVEVTIPEPQPETEYVVREDSVMSKLNLILSSV